MFLKEDYQHQKSDGHELVEDCACKSHAENFGCDKPNADESKHPDEYVFGAALLHEAVEPEEQGGYEDNVKSVFNAEMLQVLKMKKEYKIRGEIANLGIFSGISKKIKQAVYPDSISMRREHRRKFS